MLKSYKKQPIKYFVLCVVTGATLCPILWIAFNSFKSNADLFTNPWGFPVQWHPENFAAAWVTANIGRYFLNSVIVTVTALFFSLLLTTTSSFAIARLKFKLAKFAFLIFTVGMMIPVHATLIPIFMMFSKIRIINTRLALIIPYVAFSMPISVLILTGFLKTFPKEIEEASIIDGATIGGMFIRVTIPICKPCIATIAIYCFMFMWNELSYALVLTSGRALRTLPLGLTLFRSQFNMNYVGLFAAITITVLPVIIVYVLFNRQIIEGMTSGALKG